MGESIGFKEWSMVCDGMERGLQSVIVRKGGIAEGREGFQFRHPQFFLFPTGFHEQAKRLRKPDSVRPGVHAEGGDILITAVCELVRTATLRDWDTVCRLEPLHLMTRETVRERFDYEDEPGVHAALVRVFRLAGEWRFPNERRYGGCRSWVTLPNCPEELLGGRAAVLEDRRFEPIQREFEAVCGVDSPPIRP